jgi:hypothetical protein
MFCSDDVKALAGAMLKVQAEVNPAVKDSANPFAKSRYASLNSVVTASRESLLRNGIWVVQYPVPVEPGHLGLVTRLTHAASGQWQSGLIVMPLAKHDPQGYGSAMTYARRYSIAALIGLIVEDDDGETACGRPANGESKFKKCPDPDSPVKDGSSRSDSQPETADQDSPSLMANLPNLDGINYQTVKANDGKTWIVATGDTFKMKSSLSANGFRWNSDRKIWWRYAEAA